MDDPVDDLRNPVFVSGSIGAGRFGRPLSENVSKAGIPRKLLPVGGDESVLGMTAAINDGKKHASQEAKIPKSRLPLIHYEC